MTIKKLIANVLVVGMIATSLTGCGKKVTTESLLEECKVNQKNITSASEQINMDLALDFSMSGVIMPIEMNASLSLAHEGENVAYVNGNVDINALEQNQSVPIEIYTVVGEDNITTYSYDADSEAWSSTTDKTDKDKISDIQKALEGIDMYAFLLENKEDITLEKDLVKHNNKDCYVLTGTMNTKEFSEYILNNLSEEAIEVFEITEEEIEEAKAETKDMVAMEFPVKCYIYKDSVLPAYLEFDLTDSLNKYEKDINNLINDMSGIASEELEEEEATISISCSFEEFKLTVSFDKYNETKVEVPAEVKESATNENIDLEF